MRSPPLLAIGALSLLSACGSSDVEPLPEDDDGDPSEGCPAGSYELDDSCELAGVPANACATGFEPDGAQGCVPVLPSDACPPGTMAIMGETACREVAPCGSGPWGDVDLATVSQFVDASFAGTSDGTQAQPWTTIQQAVDAAASAGTIAVAEGSYVEDVVITGKTVSLVGRCPDRVEVVGTGLFALQVINGASATKLRSIAVRGAQNGVGISGAEDVELDRVWLHDTGGFALDVESGLGAASATMRDSLIEQASGASVFVYGTSLRVERSSVRDTQPVQGSGRGFDVTSDQDDARLAIVDSRIERHVDVAVVGIGGELEIAGCLIRDTLPNPIEGDRGFAVAVQSRPDGAPNELQIDATVIERAHDVGLSILGSDAVLDAVTIRDVLPRPGDLSGGRAITIEQQPSTLARSTATIRRSAVQHVRDTGVHVSASDVTLEALLIEDVAPNEVNGLFGRGVTVQRGVVTGEPASATLTTSHIEATRDFGVILVGGALTVDRTYVAAASGRGADGLFGDGISVIVEDVPSEGSVVDSRIASNARAGVSVFGGKLVIAGTDLSCNPVQLASEPYLGAQPQLEDGGGNTCGCGAESGACKAVSQNLQPPDPL